MTKFVVRQKVSDIGQKKDKPKAPEKPPYAIAPRSMNIPDYDPKPRVNADYKRPPKQLMKKLI